MSALERHLLVRAAGVVALLLHGLAFRDALLPHREDLFPSLLTSRVVLGRAAAEQEGDREEGEDRTSGAHGANA